MKEKKSAFIIIRVTVKEKAEFIKKAGGSLSKYLRDKLGLK